MAAVPVISLLDQITCRTSQDEKCFSEVFIVVDVVKYLNKLVVFVVASGGHRKIPHPKMRRSSRKPSYLLMFI